MHFYENFFFPFNRAETHEDQLTRALIVLIKLVPAVEVLFLEKVREAQHVHPGHPPRFPLPAILGATSRTRLVTQAGKTVWADIPETKRLVSVLLTDEKLAEKPTVMPSQRGAIYDAVLVYKPDLALVVENKPAAENVWFDQLNPNVAEYEIDVDKVPAIVIWSDIIQGINDLVLRGVIEGTDQRLVQDFLSFVQKTYPQLYPYRNFFTCARLEEPLRKRCLRVLSEVGSGVEPQHQAGWKPYLAVEGVATHVALDIVGGNAAVEVEFYPGDTSRQAREFFERVDVDGLCALSEGGWKIEPNFHVAYMAKNLVWFKVGMSTPAYLNYWKGNLHRIAQVKRKDHDFAKLFNEWVEMKLASSSDFEDFDKKVVSTKREFLNVCPGVAVKFRWPLTVAEALDVEGRFVDELKHRIKTPMTLWKQTFVPRAS